MSRWNRDYIMQLCVRWADAPDAVAIEGSVQWLINGGVVWLVGHTGGRVGRAESPTHPSLQQPRGTYEELENQDA